MHMGQACAWGMPCIRGTKGSQTRWAAVQMGKQEWVAGKMGGQGVVGGCEDGQARCENRSGWQVLLAIEGAREASASQTGWVLASWKKVVAQTEVSRTRGPS